MSFENPYDVLLDSCNGDSVHTSSQCVVCDYPLIYQQSKIQAYYESHRLNRNAAQEKRMLSSDFAGLEIDPILYKLVNSSKYPGYVDPRHCLVFWARPTTAIKKLIRHVQDELLKVAPSLWVMPQDNLHMTTLEITHTKTEHEIKRRLTGLESLLGEATNFTFDHRAKLIRPMLSFDASAMALSFVPAAGDTEPQPGYTYHHLRRDLFEVFSRNGIEVDSRYVLPSAHLTVARFVSHDDTAVEVGSSSIDPIKVGVLIDQIKAINSWLQETYWQGDGGKGVAECCWIVGQEKGLDCNIGKLWYGNGERVKIGKGF